LTNLSIGNGVTNIGIYAFSATTLSSVTIPNSVTSIGRGAFDYFTNLTSVKIPDSVSSIGGDAFYGCTSLTSVYFQGNAPSAASSLFLYDNHVTAYYLPGTTGWAWSFGGILTVLWLPQVQATDTSFGVKTNHFGFNVTWADDMSVVVEASPSLSNPVWSPVVTNTLNGGTFYFTDPDWTKYPSRFYRVRTQ
jgi:hypothetical protein